MPRLFTGLEIPGALCERLARVRGKLEGARWIDPENYHVTLRFLGDVDDIVASDFAEQLSRVSGTAFEIAIDGLGSFGGRSPRSVWANVVGGEALARLQQANERAATAIGHAPESRNFKPHVTLARLRRSKPAAVAEYLEHHGAFISARFAVERFVLYSSRPASGGGPYVVEESYPLKPLD